MHPIRKINPSTVALSSYYGKVFVNRSERKQFDEMSYLSDKIMEIGLAGGSDQIKKIAPAQVFDNRFKSPRVYSALSMKFKYIHTPLYTLVFDHKEREKLVDGATLKRLEQDRYIVAGSTKKNEPILVDYNNTFYLYRDNEYISIGNIYDLLGLDAEDAPIEYSELKVFSKGIPAAVVLGYYIGITKVVKLCHARPKVIPANSRYTPEKHEWVLRFKDYKLIFNRNDRLATLMMAGFLYFKETIRQYDFKDFDSHAVYLNLLDQRNLSARYLKELDTLNQLFIDPITESILREMQEPVTFQGLLVRSTELLLTDWHPDTNDMRYMRIKGYERVAGLAYREMINSVREYKSRNIRGKSQLSMNPYAIWRAITADQTVKMSEDINPINELKEMEALTYVGADGRAKDAMTKTAREFHETDMGVVSESTVDSGDVAINTFLSANPKIRSIRGITDRFEMKEDGATSLLSTSALLAPACVTDD